MRKITEFAVKFPVTVFMLMLGIILLGIISLGKLGVDLFPDMDNPRIYIELKAGERPPEEIEDLFVDRIEAQAIRQNDVVNVSSKSQVGAAQITVEYTWNKDMDEAYLELQKAMASFGRLDDLDELNITQHDPNAAPVMLIAMQHNEIKDLNELRKVGENYIRNELIRIEGIAEVELSGEEIYEVVIETNDARLKSFNLTTQQVASKIENYNQNVSGGSIVEMGRKYVVKGLSEVKYIEDLNDIILRVDRPTKENSINERVPLRLSDVATVTYVRKDQENTVRMNGEKCIGLAVYKETRYNTVKAIDQLNEELLLIQKALPGYTFTVVQDQGSFISAAISEVEESALYGIILAVFVLLIFLRRIGPTIIISISIPISIIATFTIMYFQGLTLNIMTLGGLALGAGMLVDNAIVVMENIFRNHESGMSRKDAAVKGAAQVGGAILASTLTTVVVFLPIVYIQGASGALFKEQALTVTYSLLCSFIVAILVIPMLYALTGGKKSIAKKENKSVQITGYGRFLEKVIDARWMIVSLGIVLMVGGYFMITTTGSEFMPKTESKEFFIHAKLPQGTNLDRTDATAVDIETIVREMADEHIEFVYTQAGPSAGLEESSQSIFEDQNTAVLKVVLKEESNLSAISLMQAINAYYEKVDDVDVLVKQEETALQSVLGNNGAPVVVELIGEDFEILEDLSHQVMTALVKVNGLINLSSSIEGGAPEVEVTIDRYRAGMMNIEVSDVVNTITQMLEGTEAGQMDVEGEMNDILIKIEKIGLNQLENILIKSGDYQVPIREIASIAIKESPREILHNNQNRIIEITADIEGEIPLDKLSEEIRQQISEVAFPHDYKYNITGEEKRRAESMENLSFALILSLILVYMVLASQFESLVHPFTILLTVPLSVVGGVSVFFLSGQPLNIMAYIGLIMLVGIAVNDSIILIDAINQLRKEVGNLKQAIVLAGQRRIRPIIMTTLTTILALLPLTFGFGEAASLRSPMAWAVIGGLVTSTLLTLIIIPCVYYLFASIGAGKKELKLQSEAINQNGE